MKKICLCIIIFYSVNLRAHPVIYKGGWVYQGTFMPMMSKMRFGHSLSSRYALVANSSWFKDFDNYRDYTVGMNFLLKRWLQKDSQGNIYGGAHLGRYHGDSKSGNLGNLFLMADWESRSHYVVAQSKTYHFSGETKFDYTFRYGFAPFVAGMNTLQTWLILQAYYFEQQSKEVIVTPMIRFFYRNVLWETGYSTKGHSFLTLMVHF